MSSRRKIILVSGWRGIPHSYAIVNQFQCLELLRRDDVQLFFNDVPFLGSKWEKVNGLFTPEDEEAIANIPNLSDGVVADAELRISGPYDFTSPPRAERTFVFGTAELGYVPDYYIAGEIPLSVAHASHDSSFVIITPSAWSAAGFVSSGADPARVKVVPHGIDTDIYHPPTEGERLEARKKRGIADDDFVFMHVGAMSENKNVAAVLGAFASVQRRHPKARLLLKGTDALYESKKLYMALVLGALRETQMGSAISRVNYIGDTLSFDEMASLYQAADCYVAPYTAEGFNLPALEAAACGLPVICTSGGPTDEFTDQDFALYIRSSIDSQTNRSVAQTLAPDTTHLEELMIEAIENHSFRERASLAGPDLVSREFTWERVVDRLLAVMGFA